MLKSPRKRAGKKVALVLLSIFLLLILFSPTAAAAVMLGDVDGSETVDVRDVVLVMKHILEIELLEDAQKAAADVNGDGDIKVNDVTLIMQYILGIIDEFPVPATLAVNSVNALNLRQVEVVFNRPVDRTSAKTLANYTANMGITFSDPILSDGDRKVTLFASANLSKIADTTVTIQNVKSADLGQTLSSTSKTIRGKDDAIPTVVKTEALGSRYIMIYFSEPVQRADHEDVYFLNTTALSAANATATYVAGRHHKEVLIELDATVAMPIGPNSLFINDGSYLVGPIIDYDGKQLQPRNILLTVQEDLTLPSVSSAAFVDQTTVRVTFNKPVNLSEGSNYSANFYWNTSGTIGFVQYPADAVNTIERLDAQTFYVKFTTNPIIPGTFYFFATGVRDFNDVAIATSKTELTAVADVGLGVIGISSPQDNQIRITFNRAVTAATAENINNYTVKNASNVVQTITSAVRGGALLGDNVVTLTMASNLPGGTYSVEIRDIKDNLNNTIPVTVKEVTVTDTTPISSFSIIAVAGITNDRIVVSYPEAMQTTGTNGIGTKTRYEVQVNGGGFGPLAAEDTISVAADGRSATILFATNAKFAAGNLIDVRINLVADASGNQIPWPLTASHVAISEADGIDITGLVPEITAARKVELTVPRHLMSISPADFVLYNATTLTGYPVSVLYSNSTEDETAVIELTAGFDLNLAQVWRVSTNPVVTGTFDIAGIKIKEAKTSGDAINAIPPELIKASVHNATTIRVQFSKAMGLVVPGDFRVTVGAVTQTPTAQAVVVPNVYDFTLGSAIDVAATPNVRTIEVPQSVDTMSKNLKANTTGITAGNFTIGTVTLNQGSAVAIEGSEKVIIIFSEAVDPAILSAGWDGTGTVVESVVLAAAANTITMPNVGVLTFNADVITGNQTLLNATYGLSFDKKTLTVTLVGLLGTNLNEGLPATATLVANSGVKAAATAPAVGNYINVAVTAQTITQLATTAITVTVDAANDKITFLPNWKKTGLVAGDFDFSDIYAKINAAHADFTNATGTFAAGPPAEINTLLVDNTNNVKAGVTVAQSTVSGTGTYAGVTATVPPFAVSVATFAGVDAVTID